MNPTREPVLCFYGKLAGATRREAGRLARGAGYRVAETLHSGADLVVLGEGEPLQTTRMALAGEFDEKSMLAFERGTLRIITETEFLAEIAEPRGPGAGLDALAEVGGAATSARPFGVGTSAGAEKGATPAAAAGIVGTSIGTIRRWLRRGLIAPIDPTARLPILSPRAILVARRLALLCSGELSEETVEKRIRTFAAEEARRRAARARMNDDGDDASSPETRAAESTTAPTVDAAFPLLFAQPADAVAAPSDAAPDPEPVDADVPDVDLGDVVMTLTLSTDGRELLQYRRPDDDGDAARPSGPTDSRGQRFFDFAAFPPDGALDVPAPVKLSPEEEQIALAERLSEWNAKSSNELGVPAFLALFPGDDENVESVAATLAEEPAALPASVYASDAALPDAAASAVLPVESARVVPPYPAAPAASAPDVDLESDATFAGEARARWRAAASLRQASLCEEAWALEREGYWEEAARAYRLAALAGGADPGVNLRLGRVLQLLGDYGAARERFHAALELDPDLSEARVELGRAYVALGDYDEALGAFRSALEHRPGDPLLRVELGKLCLQRGDRAAAEEQFRLAASRVDDPGLANDVRRLLVTLERG